MKRLVFLFFAMIMACISFAQIQTENDLWVFESKEVVDSVKADSLYEAYKSTLKERMRNVWAEPIIKIITAIDALMEYENSGNKIELSNYLFRHLLRLAHNNKDVTEKELKIVSKGKVPKGFTDKVLAPAKAQLQAKIDAYNPNMPSWDNVFTYHLSRYEIEYTSSEYQDFDVGNQDGPRTRFVSMETITLPHKNIAVTKPNPNCRDNYFNGNLRLYSDAEHPWRDYESHEWDEMQQSQGWEWVNEKDIQNKKEYYPEERSYRFSPSHPEYRISCNLRDNYCYHPNIYNEKGLLIRAGNIVGLGQDYKNITESVMMAICKRDFLANKYDINKSKPETLTALRIRFNLTEALDARFKKYMKIAQDARDAKMSATTPAQYVAAQKKQNEALNVLMEYAAKENEPQAMNYIKQLKSDHQTELSYLYKIERLDNVSFKLYYLNNKMECGCIALMKWSNKEPYEAQYDIELIPSESIVIRK